MMHDEGGEAVDILLLVIVFLPLLLVEIQLTLAISIFESMFGKEIP